MTAGNKLQCPDDPDVDKGIKHGTMDSSSSEAFSLQNHLRSLSVHLLLFCLISFYFHSSYLQHITPPLWALIHLLPTLTPDHSVISTHSPQTPAWPYLSVWPLQTRRSLKESRHHCVTVLIHVQNQPHFWLPRPLPSGRLYTPPSTLMKQTSHLQRSFSAWSHTAADWSSPLFNRASTTRSRLQGMALYILQLCTLVLEDWYQYTSSPFFS